VLNLLKGMIFMQQRTMKLIIFIAAILLVVGYLSHASTAANSGLEVEPQRRKPKPRAAATPKPASANYAKFNHRIAEHQAQNCDACHKFPTANWKTVRKGEDAFEDVTEYPSHASCLSCHRQQFFKGAQPSICTICHTNPGPRNSTRHPFPNPSEIFDPSPKGQAATSQYEIFFPHDKHMELFGQVNRREATLAYAAFRTSSPVNQAATSGACATCHKLYQPQGDASDEFATPPPKNIKDDDFWLKKGAFISSPSSHASCFSCHTQGGGMKPEPTDCATCHKLSPADKLTPAQSDFDAKLAATMNIKDKTTLTKWGRREASKFRHEWFSHAELKCTDCHTVAAINTADGKGAEVNVLSCGGSGSGCHITPTADEGGALNFEITERKTTATFQCVKCHVNQGKKAIPESHLKALSAITKK
jgi:hypothetical protein